MLALAVPLAAGCGGDRPRRSAGSASTADPTATATGTPTASPSAPSGADPDWPTFDHDPARTGTSAAATGITAANARHLRRQRVRLPGTVDSAPIYLHRVTVAGARRDVFVATTTYGRTVAVDARSGRLLWTFTPRGYRGWAGTYRLTQSSPTADADRAHVFSTSPDGRVHRLALATGREARGGAWPVALTRDPTHEKLTSSLNLVGRRLIVTTGGYLGDAPPYQGHVVTLDRVSGRILAVFNSLCSNVRRIQVPRTCAASDSAIWARAGAVLTPRGTLLVSTGNGPFDGRRNWGDSVLELGLKSLGLRQSWTPTDQARLEASDADLGSSAPVVVPGAVLQSGKAGRLVVLRADRLNGRTARPGPLLGGERQSLPNPGGGPMFSAPAVWTRRGRTTVFATTGSGTAAYAWRGGRLSRIWEAGEGGTSPIVAGGLLFVYDAGGELVVRRPGNGHVVARLPAGRGHWNSPVVAPRVVALPEGDGNDRQLSGVLNLYRPG